MTPQPTAVFTINTLANPNITAQPEVSQEICENGLVNALQVSANGSGNTYQWYSNTGNTNTGGDAINGQITTTYTPSSLNAGTFYYYVTVTNEGCSTTSNTAAVIVSPALAATITPNPEQTVCEGDTVALNVSVLNGQGTATYQWYQNTTGVIPADSATDIITGEVSATEANYTFTAATSTDSTTTYYYAIVNYTGGSCQTVTSDLTAVVVTQTPVIASGANLLYTGTAFTYDPTTEAGNTIPTGTQYTWTVSNPGNITGASAETTPQNVISQTLTNTGTTDITINYTVTPIFNTCEGTPFQVAVTVTAPINVTATITNASCFEDGAFLGNGAIEISITGGVAPYTATWSAVLLTDIQVTDEDITGLTSRRLYSQRYRFCIGNEISRTYTITQPTINPIDPATSVQNICVDGDTTALEVSYIGSSAIPTYEWYINTTNTNTGGTPIANTNTASYTPAAGATQSTDYYYAEIKLGTCAPKPTAVFTINTLANPNITAQPVSPPAVCQNTTAAALSVTATSADASDLNYQWYANTIDAAENGTAIPGQTQNQYTPSTLDVGTAYYYAVVTQGTSGCTTTTTTAAVTVNPALAATITPNTTQTVCEGDTVALNVSVLNGQGTATYQWYQNTTGVIPADSAADIITDSATDADYTFTAATSYS